MLFNSLDFAIFLPIVFVLYWFVNNHNLNLQNALIVIASYVFYGWWDWRFLSLIIFSTLVDYSIGVKLKKEENHKIRKTLLWTSIIVNLGFLGFFKYYNFFLDNFIAAFSLFGQEIQANTLNIILPVGISFYTFQTLSYTIDVYKKKLEPTKDFIAFSAFVCFFPQLVAGPIERATNLLPQFYRKRTFSLDESYRGLRLILWGLVRKIVIADKIAPSVDEIFLNYSTYSSLILIFGAFLFSLQIYCDFSGYSMIARGVAKLLGFDLMLNFNYPYFSRNIGEFWRKWHISLSTWFRDYLYFPLGGSRETKMKTLRNIFIIFLVSGFWHGANWTFIFWGIVHALLFVPSVLKGTNRKYTNDLVLTKLYTPKLMDIFKITRTFTLVSFCWIFFRASDIDHALDYITRIVTSSFELVEYINPYDNQPLDFEFFWIFIFIFLEYLIANKIISLYSNRPLTRILVDALLLLMITLNNPIGSEFSFIYFQF